MSELTNTRYEAFAQARCRGLTVTAAYVAAGFTGQKTNASRISRRPEVRARIAELQHRAALRASYDLADAVQYLAAILHARPGEAGPDNPMCEARETRKGDLGYFFPPKLAALERLAKMLGWEGAGAGAAKAEPPAPPRDTLKEWLVRERNKHNEKPKPAC
jgi:hypothetical protein